MLIPSAQQLRSEITLNLQTHTTIGDARRQPALSLDGEAHINGELKASLRGQLSRWPNAWPALPPDLGTNAVAIVFDASYQGPRNLTAPIAFNATRADTTLQGRLRVADVNAWIKRKFDTPLPPIEAALRTPQLDVGGMQLRGVQMEIRDDVVPSQPVLSQPAPKPAVAAPKS